MVMEVAMQRSLLDLMDRYRAQRDEVMLDIAHQWLANNTSGTAIKEGYYPDHSPINSTLMLRYGFNAAQAENAIRRFEADVNSNGLDARCGYIEAREIVNKHCAQEPLLKDAVLKRLKTAPIEAQYAAWLFMRSQGEYHSPLVWGDDFAAVLHAASDVMISNFNRDVVAPLTALGFLNGSHWTSIKGNSHSEPAFAEYMALTIKETESVVSLPALPDYGKYVDAVFDRRRVPLLVALEEVLDESIHWLVARSPELMAAIVPQRHLVGKSSSALAINPRICTAMQGRFLEKKLALLRDQGNVERVLGQLREEQYPNILVKPIDLFPGILSWQVQTSDRALSERDILLVLAPWLTRAQVKILRQEARSNCVAILSAMMGIPELNDVFREAYGTDIQNVDWLIVDTTRAPSVQRALMPKPPLLTKILGRLGFTESAGTGGGGGETPPAAQCKITFPPFDDGRSLVFGRGVLDGKLAWGFRSGSGASESALVTSDLTSVSAGHIALFMSIRSGKSTLASSFLLQAAFQGLPAIVVDPKPDYVASLLPIEAAFKVQDGYAQAALPRFITSGQDIRGFDLRHDVPFSYQGAQYRLRLQIITIDPARSTLPRTRVYRAPLVVLPKIDEPDLEIQCAMSGEALANQIMRSASEKGYNELLAKVLLKMRQDDPDREFVLAGELIDALDVIDIPGFNGRHVDNVSRALRGYRTKTAAFFASTVDEVSNVADLIRPATHEDGSIIVPITVVDVSGLPGAARKGSPSPQREFITQLCGQVYHWLRSNRSKRPVDLMLVMDEAQNYLPNPSEQYNYIRKAIQEGASLGIKVILATQTPQDIDMTARQQMKTFGLANIPDATVSYLVPHSKTWTASATEPGTAVVIDQAIAPTEGAVCNTFTSPQFVGLLSPAQIRDALSGK